MVPGAKELRVSPEEAQHDAQEGPGHREGDGAARGLVLSRGDRYINSC